MATVLILLTLGSVMIFGLAGWQWPRLQVWSWIDAIYYPLAIVGVLLFFFEGVDRRKVSKLEEYKVSLEAEFATLEANRPISDMALAHPNSVRHGSRWLGHIIDLNRSCETNALVMSECIVVDYLAPIVATAQKVLATYSGPEDLFGVCTAANNLFNQMSSDSVGLSSFITRPLSEHYFEGLKRGFGEYEFESVNAYIDEIKPDLDRRTEEIIELIPLNENDQRIMRPIYMTEIDYGILIMKTFEVCMRAPKSIREGQYAEWNLRRSEKLNEVEALDKELRQQRLVASELNAVGKFRFTFWPFFLIAALALKFGKGVAHLRKGKLHIFDIFRDC